ncbi:hypothetical protein EYR36_001724 [Pleurotus pulmonarius]|nr:hypothetical protein EYR36_008334 [Pleurotus pulmonarius]KAF4579904.1 hypothetical protein EYR36_001724 [Pleurotus pulmonarius]
MTLPLRAATQQPNGDVHPDAGWAKAKRQQGKKEKCETKNKEWDTAEHRMGLRQQQNEDEEQGYIGTGRETHSKSWELGYVAIEWLAARRSNANLELHEARTPTEKARVPRFGYADFGVLEGDLKGRA